jgi:pimeloyl-ACP methyl ester carboxylesterase
MPNLEANGISIYFERTGSGPPLLYCNGSGTTIEGSRIVFDPFAKRFDLAVHDARGLGKTTIPPPPYTMAEYAADALAVADHLGWSTFRLVGISFGGMVAQELAVTWPDRVERLALMCTSPGGPGLSSYPLHELADLPPEEAKAIGFKILDTRFTPEFLADHPADAGLAEMMAARQAEPKSEQEQQGLAAQLEARSHHDVCDRLARITCPTFVAGGKYDGIAPPKNSEAIAARVSGSTLHLYEGGHAFFAQDPTAFPEVIEFLAG